MKKYNAPELKVLAFAAEEGIAAVGSNTKSAITGSNIFNDGEFGGW